MASVRKHRDRWQVRWRLGTQERSQTFDKRREAERFASQIETDIARGDYIDPKAGLITVGDYAERWMDLRRGLAWGTTSRDRTYLDSMILPEFGRSPVVAVRTSDVQAWIVELNEGRKPATVRKARAILSNVLELARRDLAIRYNPVADSTAPKLSARTLPGRALNDSELSAIIESAEEIDETTAPLVWLMARGGLRISEARALRTADIDRFGAGTVHIDRSIDRAGNVRPPKGHDYDPTTMPTRDRGRIIPAPPDLVDRLRKHSQASKVSSLDGYLVTNQLGAPVGYNNWRSRRWDRIVALAGTGPVRPHDLRHTAATRLFVTDRWSPAEVQAFLGHTDPSLALRIYAHVNAESLPRPSALGGAV